MAYRLVFHYFPGDSPLHRWDARCKFVALAVTTFGLLHGQATALLAFSLLLGMMVAAAHLPWQALVRDLKAWTLILLFLFLVQALSLSDPQTPLLPWLPVTEAGLLAAGMNCWSIGLMLGYGVFFTFVTRPRDLQDALIWFLKPFPFLPSQRIALMVTLTLRFVPLLMDQMEEVSLANRARLGHQRRGLLQRAKHLVLPLFRRALIRTDELALALVARGYREDRIIQLPPLPLGHALTLIPLFLLVLACSPPLSIWIQHVFAEAYAWVE